MLRGGFLAGYAWTQCPAGKTMCLSECKQFFYAGPENERAGLPKCSGEPGGSTVYGKAIAYITTGVPFPDPDSVLSRPDCAAAMVPGSFRYLDGTCRRHHVCCAEAIQVYISSNRFCRVPGNWQLGNC